MLNENQIHMTSRDFFVVLAMAFIPEGPPRTSAAVNDHLELSGNANSIRPWTYQALAEFLDMSPSQTHKAIHVLGMAGLIHGKSIKGKIDRGALADFIIHGARYAFPAKVGAEVRGILTGVHSSTFNEENLIAENSPVYVWPSPRGSARGQSIAPLCKAVLTSYRKDVRLYQALAYFDVLRVGSARERELAVRFFREGLAWRS